MYTQEATQMPKLKANTNATRELQLDFMDRRSELILEGLRDDYLPEEYLEDLVTDDEAPHVYQALAFLCKYYDKDDASDLLIGLGFSMY